MKKQPQLPIFIVVGALILIAGIVIASHFKVDLSIAKPAAGTVKVPLRFELGSVKKDIVYCGDQKLDLYEPRQKLYDTQPVVMYIHGGGWHKNNKSSDSEQRDLIDGLRDKGFAIASIDYRKQPKYSFPAPVEDSLCAVRFLRANSVEYQLDQSKIAVFGYSAGGNLAAMVGVLSGGEFNNGQYQSQSSRVSAVVTLAGVFNFYNSLKPNSRINIRNLMQNTPYSIGQPVTYVTPDDPPFLLVHGKADSVVMLEQDVLFAKMLWQNGVPYQTMQVDNAEHGLSRFGGQLSPSKDQVSEKIKQFIMQNLGVQ